MESPRLDAIDAERAEAEPTFRRVRARHRIEGVGEDAGLWMEVADVELLGRLRYDVDLFRACAPLVLAWNVAAPVYDDEPIPAETWDGVAVPERTVPRLAGWERLPPPAEAGPDVFLRVPDQRTLTWIFARLRNFGAEPDAAFLKSLARRGPTRASTTDGAPPSSPASPSPTGSPPAPTSSSPRSKST
jgi:hypothetical protein